MAWTFRKGFKIAPGLRMTLGKRGVSLGAGVRGARVTMHSSGRKTLSTGAGPITIRKTVGGRAAKQEGSAGCALVLLALIAAIAYWLFRRF